MGILILGLVLFIAPHLLREMGLRQSVKHALPSEGAYMGLYSLVTLAGLGLIIWGKSIAPFQMIWQPIYEWRSLTLLLMIPSLILFVAGNMPLSYLRKILRNPMLLAVFIWSVSHLWSNGDLASILLFGSFAAWSCIKLFSMHSVTTTAANTASKPPSLIWDIISIVGGLTLYALLSIYHGQLFGVGISLV
jgi:uncharacterized membrane protein